MTHAAFSLARSWQRRPLRTVCAALFVALLVVAQALAVAHRSDAAEHVGGVIALDGAGTPTQAAIPHNDTGGSEAGDAGHGRDGGSCELCHVAGKLPAIAAAALARVAAAAPNARPRTVLTRIAAASARYCSALPRAPPRATIETH